MFFVMSKRDEKIGTIEDLYPGLTTEEQADAEETLRRYLAVTKRVYQYISDEKPEILTELRRRASLRKQRKARR